MKTLKTLSILCLSLLVMAGCAKKPNAVDAEQSANAAAGADQAALSDEERAAADAAELEKKKARLQELLDRIMAEDIYFDFDRSAITDQAKSLLSEVAEIMVSESRFELVIEGHTDERGTESYNMSLGSKRAKAVQQFLADLGVGMERLTTISYGEEAPKVEGSGEEAWSKNRRAHFKVNVR